MGDAHEIKSVARSSKRPGRAALQDDPTPAMRPTFIRKVEG